MRIERYYRNGNSNSLFEQKIDKTMIEKELNFSVKKAANGFIVIFKDERKEPFVFVTEDQVVDWFAEIMKTQNTSNISGLTF